MSQEIYILTDKKYSSIAERISNNIYINKLYYADEFELTADILLDMAINCPLDYFYVIVADKEIIFPEFDFTFKPAKWDSKYLHIWDNDKTIRLFNKIEVLKNPANFTDKALSIGNIDLKNISKKIYEYPTFDIVFLSYDESYADENYNNLKLRFPRAKRIHGVTGILEAHKKAAALADTNMVYIVDADAEISPTFKFDYYPNSFDADSVHVWHSQNPINGLEYGYGGIKLFPTKKLLEYTGSPIDFTTNISENFKVMSELSNVTRFNTDPFSCWRSAFRECTKLASGIIPNQDNTETEERLRIWCTIGEDQQFGDFAILGANEGMEFGKTYINQPEYLRLINDYNWLQSKFEDGS